MLCRERSGEKRLIVNYRGRDIEIDDNERQENEVYSRVVGYFRPISQFNIGQKQMFKDRKYYTEGVFDINEFNRQETVLYALQNDRKMSEQKMQSV